MTDRVLSDAEIEKMQTPLWDQAKEAVDAGDPEVAKALIDRAVGQWAGLKDYSINWITSLLTFIADELGEEAVERALRKTGDEFVRPRRDTGTRWGDVPAAQRAKVIARSMLGNMGAVEVSEDDEKIVLAFQCGSGGKLIETGAYEGEHPYRTLTERSGRTFIARIAARLLRALLGEQRDPAGRVGRVADEHRAPARARRRPVRPPRVQGRAHDPGRGLRADRAAAAGAGR